MFPSQPVPSQAPPVRVIYGLLLYTQQMKLTIRQLTFSSIVSWATRAAALAYDSAQSPVPLPNGLG